MPLQLPNLDDRTYDDLVEEARSLIPTYAPDWTNHNPSDPGITLIELFAYLTEILIYRLNRVTDANVISFLRLLNGSEWQPTKPTDLTARSQDLAELLAQDIQETVRKLRKRDRAVTCEDFEALVLEVGLEENPPVQYVARARCLPRRNLLMQDFETDRAGHIGILIVPKRTFAAEISGIIAKVTAYLEPRRLLTTHLHVIEAQYRKLQITTTVVPLPDTKDTLVLVIKAALQRFLAPLTVAPDIPEDEPNWAFGRNVFVSEIYQLLDQLDGVDYVTQVELQTDAVDRRILKDGSLVGIEIRPYELIANLADSDIDITLDRTTI